MQYEHIYFKYIKGIDRFVIQNYYKILVCLLFVYGWIYKEEAPEPFKNA